MNKLSLERRCAIIQALCEGNSVRATCRLTGAAKGTVLRLLEWAGTEARYFHDFNVVGIAAERIQADEIWSFVGCKEKLAEQENRTDAGDLWTWVGIDADTKLVIEHHTARRVIGEAHRFMRNLAARLTQRVQLTTDGHHSYLTAVADAFDGWHEVDFAQIQKVFGQPFEEGTRKYSPPVVVGTKIDVISGEPDEQHISTSYVERQNLTMRMQSRRFTRLTNGFSKKIENHKHAVALHFVYYNFCRSHQTLTRANNGIKTSPAMAAGLTNHVWSLSKLLDHFENGKGN